MPDLNLSQKVRIMNSNRIYHHKLSKKLSLPWSKSALNFLNLIQLSQDKKNFCNNLTCIRAKTQIIIDIIYPGKQKIQKIPFWALYLLIGYEQRFNCSH